MQGQGTKYGFLKLPVAAIGRALLSHQYAIRIRNSTVDFSPATKSTLSIEEIRHLSSTPYIEPKQAKDWKNRQARLAGDTNVHLVQFGWRCRDDVFSPEWEYQFDLCTLKFQDENRQLLVEGQVFYLEETRGLLQPDGKRYLIILKYSNVIHIEADESSRDPSLLFTLNVAPVFATELIPNHVMEELELRLIRKRESSFAELRDHSRIAPFISHHLRLVCKSQSDVQSFRIKCGFAGLRRSEATVVKRDLFSSNNLKLVTDWILRLDWPVAVHIQALLQGCLVNPTELWSLRPKIKELVRAGGDRARVVLRRLATHLSTLRTSDDNSRTLAECLTMADRDVTQTYMSAQQQLVNDTIACPHIIFTPTTWISEGPYPEQSNRVLRQYSEHQSCFVRVKFTEENGLQYRFESDVDFAGFIKQRVGTILHSGFYLAGKHFHFLGYANSSLKEHSVWFCTPFEMSGRTVTVQEIIHDIGNFKRVKYWPARFGARLSQAFTATIPSVALTATQLFGIADVERNGSTFTDGIGTMSKSIAERIGQSLGGSQRGAPRRRGSDRPSTCQFRMDGYKGMLSVDYNLPGDTVCVRPSMNKFDGRGSRVIEIARIFDRPEPAYLNRPLIAILETLGVLPDVFVQLQREAIRATQTASASIGASASLLEAHGLGGSFRVPGVLQFLAKHVESSFSRLGHMLASQAMSVATVHILRDLMHRARILLENSWTLVGIADIYGDLKENQIFACVKEGNREPTYLEGRVLISRSPTVHPGDVQMVEAIGQPPLGSPFMKEEFPNCVVFSIKGSRSLPSCLGGGDLDGDEYVIYSSCSSNLSPAPSVLRNYEHRGSVEACSLPCSINSILAPMYFDENVSTRVAVQK